MSSKPIYACARCGKTIGVTPDDPVITASSLGAGVFHRACATMEWDDRKNAKSARGERVRKERQVRAVPPSRRCVSCGGPLVDVAVGVRECHSCVEERQAREESQDQ